MPLSWNEIKDGALKFSHEWADKSSEDAEAKSFWDAFFTGFGVPRRRVATFGDSDRVAFLFDLYQQISSPLEAKKAKRRKAAR